MQITLAKSNNKSGKYAMFIGRWQPWHVGHRWLIDQALNDGKKVLIAIRQITPDKKNPWTAKEVKINIQKELKDIIKLKQVKIIIIPDIESINIGRDVGYDIIEHVPPQVINDISSSKIREQIKVNEKNLL